MHIVLMCQPKASEGFLQDYGWGLFHMDPMLCGGFKGDGGGVGHVWREGGLCSPIPIPKSQHNRAPGFSGLYPAHRWPFRPSRTPCAWAPVAPPWACSLPLSPWFRVCLSLHYQACSSHLGCRAGAASAGGREGGMEGNRGVLSGWPVLDPGPPCSHESGLAEQIRPTLRHTQLRDNGMRTKTLRTAHRDNRKFLWEKNWDMEMLSVPLVLLLLPGKKSDGFCYLGCVCMNPGQKKCSFHNANHLPVGMAPVKG